MIGALILILFLLLISQILFQSFEKKHLFFDKKLMNTLFLYHFFFFLIYYLYTLANRSDSKAYFDRPQEKYSSWLEFFGTSTTFIDFISWPFINIFWF